MGELIYFVVVVVAVNTQLPLLVVATISSSKTKTTFFCSRRIHTLFSMCNLFFRKFLVNESSHYLQKSVCPLDQPPWQTLLVFTRFIVCLDLNTNSVLRQFKYFATSVLTLLVWRHQPSNQFILQIFHSKKEIHKLQKHRKAI